MLIARSPLRITLGGGGTDLASYYEKQEGFLISAAINKYVYILLNRTFDRSMLIKYSKLEKVQSAKELQHPIFRESLKLLDLDKEGLELCSMADIPAGTGLGSSSTFTTALLTALRGYKGETVGAKKLAEQAYYIEHDLLKEPVGKQDQYISAYGGIRCMTFQKDGQVKVENLRISEETLYNLEDGLMLFFTGYSRAASRLLKDQSDRSKQNDRDMLQNLDFVKELGLQSRKALENGNLDEFAEIMNLHWEYKRKRSGGMSNEQIDSWYELARKNGAAAGKLIGAGGGGFLMFYARDKEKLRHVMKQEGLEEVRFAFEMEGAKII